MTCRVVAPLLLVVVAAALVGSTEMLVYQTAALPQDGTTLNLNSPNLCGCRVSCTTMPTCTAVTATNTSGVISCTLSTSINPQLLLKTATTSTTFVKASQLSTTSQGEYYLSAEKNNDGSFATLYCSKESGVPASLSTFKSLMDLKAADQVDGITDIDDVGVWVHVSGTDEKIFYNGQSVAAARSGIILSTAEAGTCMRLQRNSVLATANCAYLTSPLAFACFRFTTTLTATTIAPIMG